MEGLIASEAPRLRGLARGAALPLVGARTLVAAASALAITALGAADGGYFPPAWGWAALAFAWAAALALLLRDDLRLTRLEAAWLGALVALAAWTAASIGWSDDPTQSVFEVERMLVYVAAAACVLLVAQRRPLGALLGGVLVGIVVLAGYGLATRLFPERLGVYDPISSYRLAEPLGYWNALGILAAIGIVLAVEVAARAPRLAARTAAAAAVPVLATTLYFTFGRGPWIALGFGLAAAIAVDRRRLQLITTLLVLAPTAAAAVWLGSHADALTRLGRPLSEASRDGHRLALAVALLAAAAGLGAAMLAHLERRWRAPRALRLAYGTVLTLVAAAALLAVFERYGSPPTLLSNAVDAFKAPPPTDQGTLTNRVFSFSGNGRYDLWEAAWRNYEEHAVLGSGAGSFEQYWHAHRPYDGDARDAHSLYAETLSELGPPGLALLLLALAIPIVAGARTRIASGAFGAYVAYLVHAGADWDWEMPVLTVIALVAGAALLLSDRRAREPRLVVAGRGRLAAVAALTLVTAFAVVALIGNSATAASADATADGRWEAAEREARKAATWAPWSSEPWRRLGEAHLEQGELGAARVAFRRAIAKDRRNWFLWYELALASEGRERERAITAAGRLSPRARYVKELRGQAAGG